MAGNLRAREAGVLALHLLLSEVHFNVAWSLPFDSTISVSSVSSHSIKWKVIPFVLIFSPTCHASQKGLTRRCDANGCPPKMARPTIERA